MSGVSLMDGWLVCLINHYLTDEHQVHGFGKGVSCIVSERCWCTGSGVRQGRPGVPGVSGES